MSIDYYNQNAEKFIQDTINADMSQLYRRFEKYLKAGDTILDIGCGSGRDSLYFMEKSYDVYAHDGSPAMVEEAKKHLGDKVALATFDVFNPVACFHKKITFNGLWACASLLHVPQSEMKDILRRYLSLLTKNGVFFMSFKRRAVDHEKDGRIFTNFTKEKIENLLKTFDNIHIVEYVETADVRQGRQDEGWISVIVKKESE